VLIILVFCMLLFQLFCCYLSIKAWYEDKIGLFTFSAVAIAVCLVVHVFIIEDIQRCL